VGRQLKKNNVSIDVVALGELEHNEEKLRELVDAANGRSDEERTCHLVTVPAGVLLSDVLASSPVLSGVGGAFAASAAAGAFGGGGGSSGGGGGDNTFADYGGVDPNMDPELAMALRISMEEERARQESLAATQQAQVLSESKSGDEEMTDASPAAAVDLGLSEEDALLQQALAMSMNENEPKQEEDDADANMDEDEDDAAMQMALQMSMQQEGGQFQDPAFVNDLLGTSGVDPSDPEIQEAIRKAMAKKDTEK
jgi:26S proteasome regulatory subunit N10